MKFHHPLPIDAILPELRKTANERETTLLVAPPGAGKSTRVPIAFLSEPWLSGRKIVLLEPRRIAARAVAKRMADELGEPVGMTVGYRMQGDTRVGPDTRIEVVTEGVLTRMLLHDPVLADIGLIIFDEFHERNLHADLGLALCLQSRELFEAKFRILIMSATLEADELAEKLDAGKVIATGASHPVKTVYLEKPVPGDEWENGLAATVRKALAEQEGDILVFLPGFAEIRRAMRNVQPAAGTVELIPLAGSLPADEQDRALRPNVGGRRRIIFSTPVAETGLTVEGVRVVVDSGYMRISRFNPRTGTSALDTVRISRASADQRMGRAGRTAPGVCYRLWTEEEHRRLEEKRIPEIEEADLAPLVLVLKQWGAEPGELFWLTEPPAAHCRQAEQLLKELGFLADNGHLTDSGKEAAAAGIHPRMARMMMAARAMGLGWTACRIAAVLGERTFRGPNSAHRTDLRQYLEEKGTGSQGSNGEPAVHHSIRQETKRLARIFGFQEERIDGDACGLLLSFAFPDRIALNRGNGTFLLANGRGAELGRDDPLTRENMLVVSDLDDSGANGRIHLAAPIEERLLFEYHRDSLVTTRSVEWSKTEQRVVARMDTRLGKLTLKSVQDTNPDPELVVDAVVEGIRLNGLESLPWTKKAIQLRERIAAMHAISADWPDVSDNKLLITLKEWLGGYLGDCRKKEDISRIPLYDALLAMLTWERQAILDREVPTHLQMPSGSRIPVDYGDPAAPFVAVRLQEVFGLKETPRLAGGRLPVVFHLLSPAGRPVQITRDLAGFWQNAYHEVRKELKGRYPKHYWPEDPLTAEPTNRTKPKKA